MESLDAQLAVLEAKHGVASDDLLRALDDGTVEDSADVSRWLILIDAKGVVLDEGFSLEELDAKIGALHEQRGKWSE